MREQWIQEHGREATQPELQQRGQELVSSTPFLFARHVVSQRPTSAEFLVVDGVRHHVISEALQFMFDEKAKHFGVEAPEQQVVERLAQREGKTAVNKIMAHPTEREIPELIKEANQVIRYDEAFRLDEEVLREASELAVS